MRRNEGNVGEPEDDKPNPKKRRSLISRSPTPAAIEPRDETPPPNSGSGRPPADPPRPHDDRERNEFVGVPGSLVGLVGLVGDATDAPEPAALGRRDTPPRAPARAPAPRPTALADLETPLYAPRQGPVRDGAPEDDDEKTIPPGQVPELAAEAPAGALAPLGNRLSTGVEVPAVEAGWTAPPPPARSSLARPGPSPTVVVATILTAAFVIAVFLVIGALGGTSFSDDSGPRLAPGTGAPALVAPAPAPVSPATAPAPPPVQPAPRAEPAAPEIPPVDEHTDRKSKLRLGKKKDPEP